MCTFRLSGCRVQTPAACARTESTEENSTSAFCLRHRSKTNTTSMRAVWRSTVRAHAVERRVVRVGCGCGFKPSLGSGRLSLPAHALDIPDVLKTNIFTFLSLFRHKPRERERRNHECPRVLCISQSQVDRNFSRSPGQRAGNRMESFPPLQNYVPSLWDGPDNPTAPNP